MRSKMIALTDEQLRLHLQSMLDQAYVRDKFRGLSIETLIETATLSVLPHLITSAAQINNNGQIRRRAIETVHMLDSSNSSQSPVNVMISSLLHGTYVDPHRHGGPTTLAKNEYFFRLKGEIAIVFHHENGDIDSVTLLSEHSQNFVHIEPGKWHSVICLSADAGMLEFKDGPYQPATDKEFSPFAPFESYDLNGLLDPECLNHLTKIQHEILKITR